MANIILGCRKQTDKHGNPVLSYTDSMRDALVVLGHTVTSMGEGYKYEKFSNIPSKFLNSNVLFIDLDDGRNNKGKLVFHCQEEKAPIPSVARFVDSHGNPSLHKRMAKNYDHVFFAVWARRDLFTKHPSAHWCANASDSKYFDKDILPDPYNSRPFDVGFFGSKGGIDRADVLRPMAQRHTWKIDVREIGRSGGRWPRTAEAMAQCKVLFNRGQKRDGPNQRVLESMLMERPLVNDREARDGMSKLFKEGTHYLSYDSDAELANQIEWCLNEPSLARCMAKRAYELALEKHQVKHRVEQILEVCNVKD